MFNKVDGHSVVKSIDLIIKYLNKLDVTYPPSEYGKMGPIGCMGETGCKRGIYPLRDSICLTVKMDTWAPESLILFEYIRDIIMHDLTVASLEHDVERDAQSYHLYVAGDYSKYIALRDKCVELENIG